jgi:hypothetical protein
MMTPGIRNEVRHSPAFQLLDNLEIIQLKLEDMNIGG